MPLATWHSNRPRIINLASSGRSIVLNHGETARCS
jgi:hypothetical protein